MPGTHARVYEDEVYDYAEKRLTSGKDHKVTGIASDIITKFSFENTSENLKIFTKLVQNMKQRLKGPRPSTKTKKVSAATNGSPKKRGSVKLRGQIDRITKIANEIDDDVAHTKTERARGVFVLEITDLSKVND
jgi:hypothetical protein